VKITVTDASGAVVREIKGPEAAIGDQPASWDLRREPPGQAEEGAERSFQGPPRGPLVLPGTYTVKVAAAGKEGHAERRRRGRSAHHGRATPSAASGTTRSCAPARAWTKADAADKAIKSIRKQLDELKAAMEKKTDTPRPVTRGIKDLLDKTAPLASR
jgi:hypothetical protein